MIMLIHLYVPLLEAIIFQFPEKIRLIFTAIIGRIFGRIFGQIPPNIRYRPIPVLAVSVVHYATYCVEISGFFCHSDLREIVNDRYSKYWYRPIPNIRRNLAEYSAEYSADNCSNNQIKIFRENIKLLL